MPNVLITGASRGIGKAIAEKFSKKGFSIAAPPRDELDLLDHASIERFFRTAPADFDVLINNAGIHKKDALENIILNDMHAIFQVNFTAAFSLIQQVVRAMKMKKYGKIVNISSIWGIISREKRAAYSSSKFAINGLTKSLSAELAQYNILINSVCPGIVDTEMTQQNLSNEERLSLISEIPIRRLAQPSEIAELVYFLGSNQNTYISGQCIVIDGGFSSC